MSSEELAGKGEGSSVNAAAADAAASEGEEVEGDRAAITVALAAPPEDDRGDASADGGARCVGGEKLEMNDEELAGDERDGGAAPLLLR